MSMRWRFQHAIPCPNLLPSKVSAWPIAGSRRQWCWAWAMRVGSSASRPRWMAPNNGWSRVPCWVLSTKACMCPCRRRRGAQMARWNWLWMPSFWAPNHCNGRRWRAKPWSHWTQIGPTPVSRASACPMNLRQVRRTGSRPAGACRDCRTSHCRHWRGVNHRCATAKAWRLQCLAYA